MPADAKLTVEGEETKSGSATRTLVTPPVKAGMDYYYTLKAEVTRDGQTQTVTKEVTVRAGEATQVSLSMPASGVAAR